MPVPYVRVLVDWDNNGNFSGTYDDVTDDTRSMSFTHTRQESTDYMNGGVLNVQLNNNDNKYSPPREAGPLYGKLTSGKPCAVRMWYPYDNFTDTTSTNLTSHAIPYDSGFSWSVPTGAFKCHADGYAELTSAATSIGTIDMGEYDIELSSEITTSATSTADVGLILRYEDANNYLYVRIILASNQIELRKVYSGTDSSVGFASYTWGASTKRTLMVRCHGDRISVFVDDVKVLRLATGSTTLAMQKSGKHGLYAYSSATDAKFHNFGGFRPLFKGTLKEVRPRPASGMQYAYLKAFDLFEELKLTQNFSYVNAASSLRSNNAFRRLMEGAGLQDGTADADQTRSIEDDTADYYLVTGSASGQKGIRFLEGKNFLECMYILQDTEDGFIYGDGHGMVHYESHTHRESDTHQDTATVYNDEYDGTNAGYRGFAFDDGVDGVYNEIQFGYTRGTGIQSFSNTLTSGTKTWESQDAVDEGIEIAAGETKTFIAKSNTNSNTQRTVLHRIAGSALTVTSPTGSDLVQINTAADGSGTLLNWTSTDGSLQKYGGIYGLATLRNDGASTGYIKKIQFNLVGTVDNIFDGVSDVSDSTSITTYGERRLTREDTYFDNVTAAGVSAQHRLDRVKNPIVRMRLDLINHDKSTLMQIVHRRLSDRVHVIESGMQMSLSAYVDGFSFKFSQGNTVIDQTIHVTMSGTGAAGGRWGYMRWGMNKWS
tara:strand:- start:457 stop:2598 length:2142 start_codon:yes stop_codon:yes gene_type:complete